MEGENGVGGLHLRRRCCRRERKKERDPVVCVLRRRSETEREKGRPEERERERARGRSSFLAATIFETIIIVAFGVVFAVIHGCHHCNSELLPSLTTASPPPPSSKEGEATAEPSPSSPWLAQPPFSGTESATTMVAGVVTSAPP
ncbi:hypothetical protein PIB30_058216 [Stylosanthes scabra]|uniref:Uncharacterized protein n=1 Tax=Stylosanthes scabra TaxID=79078 RepID=A0ABU6SJW1_9FABA|nr:hypothetical protein [Stylosanthes scabra]